MGIERWVMNSALTWAPSLAPNPPRTTLLSPWEVGRESGSGVLK